MYKWGRGNRYPFWTFVSFSDYHLMDEFYYNFLGNFTPNTTLRTQIRFTVLHLFICGTPESINFISCPYVSFSDWSLRGFTLVIRRDLFQ